MSEPKRPLKVFLCHVSADKPKVRKLYIYLRKRGVQPWLDAENLLAGQDWQVEIPQAIASSNAIIICISKNSVNREGYVQKEIKFALDKVLEMPEGRIFLIPARLEECEIPFSLKRYHWVDLFETDGYTKLMKSLKTRAAQLQRAVMDAPKPIEQPKVSLPWGSMIMVAGILIGAIVIIAALIGFSLQYFKPIPTATRTATITTIMTLTHTTTSAFTALSPSATQFRSATIALTKAITSTSTFVPTLASQLTVIPTGAPMSIQATMQTTRSEDEFTFRVKNVPNECNQITCELRWTVWQGSLPSGRGHYYNGLLLFYDYELEFKTLLHDSSWRTADDNGLMFVYSLIPNNVNNPDPGNFYLVNFKICTDPGIRENCKTVSDEISQYSH